MYGGAIISHKGIHMRSIDIHAHSTPQCFQRAVLAGNEWHGLTASEGELFNPRNAWTPEQRIADMDSIGVDIQVVSTNAGFYQYDKDVAVTTAICRDCNDEIYQMTMDYPDRLSGLANIPMQDASAAIAELDRAVHQLGFKGAMIGDQVNGKTFDEPEFMPIWKAAEEMGAVIFIHQGGGTIGNEAAAQVPRSQYHWQSFRPGRYLRRLYLRGGNGQVSRPEGHIGSRRRLRLLRHRPHGPGLAGAV